MKVDARQCDGDDCERILLAGSVVTVRKTFRGEGVTGSLTLDLCHDCVADEIPLGMTLTSPKGKKAEPEDSPAT